MLLADRGYDADWLRELVMKKGAWANILPKSNRSNPICFRPYLYHAHNRAGRFFNWIKQCRRVARRHDRLRYQLPCLPSTRVNQAMAEL
jgi:transposase